MQVILTPNAVADMFGPGLNGFTGSVPGPPTELSPEWFNSVQQEIVNVVLGQGIALDGLVFDQLKTAIDNYAFLDPKISSSLIVQNGAALIVNNGGLLQCDPGSTVSISTDVTIGGNLDMTSHAISNVTTIGTSGLATLNSLSVTTTAVVTGVLTANGGINLAGQTLQGSAGSVVDVEKVLPDKIEFTDMASTYSATAGHMRWNSTALMFSQNSLLGKTTAIADPRRGYDATFTTLAAIADTTAEAARVVQQAESVAIEVTFRFEGTSAGSNLNWRIEASGTPGTADIVTDTFVIDLANKGYSFHQTFLWTPTDNFVAPGTKGYTFKVRLGVSAGTLTAARIAIHVTSAISV